jgi:phosphoesterase RecJ-like protein
MTMAGKAELLRWLAEDDDFLVASHYNPDGDALGATAAMGFILSALGKRFVLYNQTGVPRHYDWLPWPAPLATVLPEREFARLILLDCGDLPRAGRELAQRMPGLICANIDHHLGNPNFCQVNWVDTRRSSTGEMVGELAEELGVPLSGDLGLAVYVSLVTDTGFFAYSNSSPACLRMAARIVELGLDPAAVSEKIENQWTPAKLKLLARVLESMSLHHDGRIAVIKISRALLADSGASPAETEGLINYVRRLRGLDIAVALREENEHRVKFSLRSGGEVDVQRVAASFGGGGHRNASGGQVLGSLAEAERAVVSAAALSLAAREAGL